MAELKLLYSMKVLKEWVDWRSLVLDITCNMAPDDHNDDDNWNYDSELRNIRENVALFNKVAKTSVQIGADTLAVCHRHDEQSNYVENQLVVVVWSRPECLGKRYHHATPLCQMKLKKLAHKHKTSTVKSNNQVDKILRQNVQGTESCILYVGELKNMCKL